MLLWPSTAMGLQQPDGTTIPVGSSLQDLFNARGEAIDALLDAQIVPETFTPTCKLQFEVLQRNAGYNNAFGWYNVGAKPADNELQEFLACDDPVGTVSPLNIAFDPNYLGGDIGFYEATGGCATTTNYDYLFFSELDYNPDSQQSNPYIHLLIYNSTVEPQAFYFAWEDLLSGGDNDFDDLTTFVTGISCTGGGGACQTDQLGVCADGTLQCQQGELECLPLTEPSTEVCDGVDNDCSGEVDEGNLCPEKHVCDKGTCVPKCDSGEFPCPSDKVCNDAGLCVDPACEEITCPDNTKCVEGACIGPCDDVVCPYGQVCLIGAGGCVDPCSTFTCDPDQVCDLGACVEKCDCAGCPDGEACQPDGLCIPDACVGVDCPPGFHCGDDGSCVDDCDGAVCPKGEICEEGNCVDDPNDGEGGAGGGGDIDLGGGSSSGGNGQGGAGTAAGAQPFVVEDSTCGCRVVASKRREGAAWLLAGILFCLGGRLRRRKD